MESNKNNIEYLSLLLNLSFLLLHNIHIVFIGIILAIYCIHKTKINKFIESTKNDKIKLNCSKSKSIETDIKHSLVEEIEECGYIPSVNSKNTNIAA